MTLSRNVIPPQPTELTNALRFLAIDAIQQANSGHPGAPLGMAEIATVLWRQHLKHNPVDPQWPDRDRFVLSNGHGSMLLYALLHLTGYDLPLEEIKHFRQLHSKTPGHPEYGYTPGVETTTGPLGQGIANAVGMAIAEKALAAEFNLPGHHIIDHHTWVFVGDGCLMEGISHEVCSLAGTLQLGKLIVFYDDNAISIDGDVKGWFTDNTPERFTAYGWQVIPDVQGHDPSAIDAAIIAAKKDPRPTLICCKTIIGAGVPDKQGTHNVHGAALGSASVEATRKALGWSYPPFDIPQTIRDQWDCRSNGTAAQADWQQRFNQYRAEFPQQAAELERRLCNRLPANWAEIAGQLLHNANSAAETIASRKASQQCIATLAPQLPELIGGSADLASSNLTLWPQARPITASSGGNYIYYGVREFGMTAIANGIALHRGLIPYTATFLMFSEYARNALRMAALMKQRHIAIFTHDSIGLGEDGPTHQPVEQAATLRLIPNMDVWRPCDTVETACAWTHALARQDGPSALLLSRQNLAFQQRTTAQIADITRGGYILRDAEGGVPQVIIIATGSEVQLATAACETLKTQGVRCRLVSMPCTNLFDRQDTAWRNSVLQPGVPRVAIEAGVTDYWRKYIGLEGKVIGIDSFGESAPAEQLFQHFGITTDALILAALALIHR